MDGRSQKRQDTPPSSQPYRPTRRQYAAGFAAVLAIASTGAILVAIGLGNISTAYLYSGRMLGVTLLVFGLGLLATVASAVRGKSSAGTSNFALLLGSIGSLAASTLLLVIVLTTAEGKLWLILGLLLFSWTAWAAFYSSGIGQTISLARRVEIAALVAAILAVGNFGYSRLYEPSARPTKLDISVNIGDRLPSEGDSITFPLEITLQNIGEVDVSVIGGVYSVLGRKASVSSQPGMLGSINNLGFDELSTQIEILGYTLIQADAWLPSQAWLLAQEDVRERNAPLKQSETWLNRGEKIKLQKVVRLAAQQAREFDELAANVHATVIRRDKAIIEHMDFDTNLRPPEWVDDSVGASTEFNATWVAKIADNDQIKRKLRKSRKLSVWWIFPKGKMPHLQYMVAPDGEWRGLNGPSSKDFLEMYEEYGVTRVDSGWSEKSLS